MHCTVLLIQTGPYCQPGKLRFAGQRYGPSFGESKDAAILGGTDYTRVSVLLPDDVAVYL